MQASEEWSFFQFHDHNISITLINSWVLGNIYKSRMEDTELKPARRMIQNAVLWMMIAFEYEWWSSSWVFWLNPECPRQFQLSLFSSLLTPFVFSIYFNYAHVSSVWMSASSVILYSRRGCYHTQHPLFMIYGRVQPASAVSFSFKWRHF